MRDRLGKLIGVNQTAEVAMGTFHSICGKLIRRDAPLVGLDRNFVIYDTDDQISVVKAVLAEQNIDEKKYKPAALLGRISNAKNELLTPAEFRAISYFDEIAKRVYVRYNQILRANDAVDFDDLLMESVLMLRNNPSVLERIQDRYAHVLVDEFQDTNIAQYELAKLIAGKYKNLFCVGDPDQGIYSWRGADYRNLLRLRDDFSQLNIIPLEQNYRSTQTVLDAAMAVIKRNPNRQHIDLFTQRGKGPKIVLRELFNEAEEAQYVVDTINELVRQNAATLGEIAVMYRTNAQSRVMEDAFVRAKLPYRLVGATRFYGRKEIRDALAYLRIVNNPADVVSLRRIINIPARGIGEKTFEQLENVVRQRAVSPLEVMRREMIAGRGAKALAEFGALWQKWINLRDELSVGQLFDRIMRDIAYREHLLDGTTEGEDRWANIMELRNVVAETGDTLLPEFLAELALVSETDNYEENLNAPTLLTLHAAKGLEFRVVFIVGLEEGILPHSRSQDDPEQLFEERRLMYVGITRAKERLYLLRAFRRGQWGVSDTTEPSRFLSDLPAMLVDGMVKKPSQAAQAMATWQTPAENRAVTSAPNAQRSSFNEQTTFKPGDRVLHPSFGEGLVLRSTRLRNDEEVDVVFGVQKKRLSVTLSGLKKL
jgi:DNA helicase-2/ATP-dependent DNA helicase PcrA